MPSTKWTAEHLKRRKALTAFTRFIQGTPGPNAFVSGKGPYLVLHFDLMTIDDVDRATAYDAVEELADEWGAVRVGGSVVAVPLRQRASAKRSAALFWNALHKATSHDLRAGDSFFLHFAIDTRNLGCIAQVVPTNATSLSTVKVPAV